MNPNRNRPLFEQREQKVHLYTDQRGRKQRANGKPVDNTLCASNHGDATLLTTTDHERTFNKTDPSTVLRGAMLREADVLERMGDERGALLRGVALILPIASLERIYVRR